MLKRDDLGRGLEARSVEYVREPPGGGEPWRQRIVTRPGREIFHYAYDGDRDRAGRVTRREPVARD
ncbi:MAG: hypothetical protein ACYTJ0_21700 [Planctomycetota bacterium]